MHHRRLPDRLRAADPAVDGRHPAGAAVLNQPRFTQEAPSALGQTGSVSEALAHAQALLCNHPARAADQAQAILDAVPAHPQATLLLGAAWRRLGRVNEAAARLETLAQAQPRAAAVHYELALVRAARREPHAAIASLRRAVSLRPAWRDAWLALGDMLSATGEPAQADAAYAGSLRGAADDPTLVQAEAALAQGDLQAAELGLRARLSERPTDVAALRMLGDVAIRQGRHGEAEAVLGRCLELMPGFAAARHLYAVALFRQNKAEAAIPHIEKLRAQDPRDPDYRNLLGASLAMVGEFGRAIEVYEAVLRDFPRQPKAWLSYGHALKTEGRRGEAVQAYKQAAAQAPSLGEAYWSLANLKSERFTTTELSVMQAQLLSADATVEDRLHLHYALGHAAEQAGEYPAAFGHFAEGARLRRSEIVYSAAHTSRQLARMCALFTPEFLAKIGAGGCEDEAPIFVVGLPRSGSTLIEQILASHSAIEGTMELPGISDIARALGRSDKSGPDLYPESLAHPSIDRVELGRAYIRSTRIHRKLGRPYFIDKMPNNFVHIGLIHLILPRAKIIDARRGAMAACFSAFKQHFARGQHFSYDLTELGRYYADYVALMAHVDRVLPGRVHRVRYESMVTDTEAEVRRLLDYLGLVFEPACLRFHENTRAVRTASSEQVRRPVYREGLDHWRHFEPFLGELRAALGDLAGR